MEFTFQWGRREMKNKVMHVMQDSEKYHREKESLLRRMRWGCNFQRTGQGRLLRK